MNWQDIQRYCLDRLDEIRDINRSHHCPSSFVCIAAFMGFLSRLAYGDNVQRSVSDGVAFKAFVSNFMPQQYKDHEEELYKTFRCGIVHAMSFDPEYKDIPSKLAELSTGGRMGNAPIAITHAPTNSLPTPYATVATSVSGSILTLNAFDVCDDIETSIKTMFANPVYRNNAEQFVACQRPIQGIPSSISNTPALSSSFEPNAHQQGNTP